MKTQQQNVGRFLTTFTTSRWIALGILTAALVMSVVIDSLTPFWVDNPMTTHFVAGVVLLGLTVVLVDTWIDYRAAQAWAPVAAFALEDIGAITRAVWVRNASFIHPAFRTMHIEQFRYQIKSADGASQQRAGMIAIAEDRKQRADLHKRLYETAKRTRDLIIRWAPVMVSRSPLAEYLSQLSDLHRQIVRTLLWLRQEQTGEPLPVSAAQLCDQILAINRLAETLDSACFAEAKKTAPLLPSDQLVSEIAL